MLTTEAPVISVMTVNPITINTATTLFEIRALLKQHRIRHLPVLGPPKKLVGIVSVTDLAMLDRLAADKLKHRSNRHPTSLTRLIL